MALSNYNIDGDVTIDSRGVGDIARNVPGIGVYAPNIETIQGQMITATLEIDEFQIRQMDDVALKNKVLNMLVNELIAAKCIEFTKQQDVATNTTIIRARIFATPDTHVRIIRGATK
jgi:hypothetical protein